MHPTLAPPVETNEACIRHAQHAVEEGVAADGQEHEGDVDEEYEGKGQGDLLQNDHTVRHMCAHAHVIPCMARKGGLMENTCTSVTAARGQNDLMTLWVLVGAGVNQNMQM